MLPEPGTQAWENMVDYMRADMASGMAYTKLEIHARNIIVEKGLDFDEEFEKWKTERNL